MKCRKFRTEIHGMDSALDNRQSEISNRKFIIQHSAISNFMALFPASLHRRPEVAPTSFRSSRTHARSDGAAPRGRELCPFHGEKTPSFR
jgi:hypothetical protein